MIAFVEPSTNLAGISRVASILADPSRLEIVVMLMDGRAFPVSELAVRAHVSVPTASHHLSVLLEAGYVEVFAQGRHRYYRLVDLHLAELVERLGAFAPPCREPLSPVQRTLFTGRSCYRHLAGQLGVSLRAGMEARGFLTRSGEVYEVTDSGRLFWSSLGFVGELPVGSFCLDWTERLPHIGGALGRTLFAHLIDIQWIIQGDIPRQVCLTPLGKEHFRDLE